MNDLGARFKRIDSSLNRRANAMLEGTGLTTTQLSVLMVLSQGHEDALEQRELERRLHVSHPTTTGLVKRMEAKGLVASNTSSTDARKKVVVMTSAGRAILAEGEQGRLESEATITKGLSAEELTTLRKLLDRIIDNLEDGA